MDNQNYMWDVLNTAGLARLELFTFEDVEIEAETEGRSQGRIPR
jgi:inosine-uridine nucleoside N-ribohydrolase